MNFSAVIGYALKIVLAIIIFALLIIFHELGHFLAARLFKIQVNEFSIGMGPKIFSAKKGKTLWALRAFPIGGFVSMEGEDELSESDDAFGNKPVYQRIIVVLAGILFNLLLGFIILCVMLASSSLIPTNCVASFNDDSVSSHYGLQEGDRILKIDSLKVYSSYDISLALMRSNDDTVDITVKRDGKKRLLNNVKFDWQASSNTYGRNTKSIIIDFSVKGVKPGFFSVVKNAFLQSISVGRMVYLSLFDLFAGRFSFSDLSGPIGTVNIVAKSADYGFKNLLFISALLSINIGLFNLFPIPALDGGKFLFLIIESIRRKKMSERVESTANFIGFCTLMALVVFVTLFDIFKIFKG